MAQKTIQTRIALKYDLYANWNKWYTTAAPDTALETAPDFTATGFDFSPYADKGAALILKKGEIGLCAIEDTTQATTAPTVLFKVGDGTHRFCELKWASALAADVHAWAKASDVSFDAQTKTITFVGGGKTLTIPYMNSADVVAITDPIAGDVSNIKAALADSGTTGKAIKDLKDRVDIITGDADGSFAKADAATLEAAKSYADGKASEAQQAAIGKATEFNTAMNTRVEALEAAKASQAVKNQELTEAIGHASAPAVGTEGQEGYEAAKTATGVYAALEAGDKALDERLKDVEAFFEGAKEDSAGLNDALDKLRDIQDYLSGEGSAADGLMGQVAQNTRNITNQGVTITQQGATIANHSAILAGYGTEAEHTTVKTHVDAVAAQVKTLNETTIPGVEQAYQAADAAIKEQIGNGFTKDKTIAITIGEVSTVANNAAAAAEENGAAISAINSREANYATFVPESETETSKGTLVIDGDMLIFDCGSATAVI